MAQEPKYPVQTVMKALELLNHLAKNTGNLGAGDRQHTRDSEDLAWTSP